MGIKSLYYHSTNNAVRIIIIIIIVNRYKIYCCYQQSNNNYTVRKNFEKHATAADLHTLGGDDGDRKIKHRS